ncbi:hypothetical protein BT63DRAFT_476747 [Microthyrium microscopicum]|uniref:Sld7 C-terminal domain-containing protein n=1 Tax=Microthyrium microscopicum TaxID=703497 RepID=A0A6A6UJF7_9PEZI|nr:hypothetical protein BT63DRAFT_476747 [Microthyrium microscopicum]
MSLHFSIINLSTTHQHQLSNFLSELDSANELQVWCKAYPPMASNWCGKISLPGDQFIEDVNITDPTLPGLCDQLGSTLEFLSLVEIFKLPAVMILRTGCSVWTHNDTTQNWFSDKLISSRLSSVPNAQAGIGILARGDSPRDNSQSTITEVLFSMIEEPANEFRVQATFLCSSKLEANLQDNDTNEEVTVVLGGPPAAGNENNSQNIFDLAQEQRRRTSGRGGVGVAAAAAFMSPRPSTPASGVENQRRIAPVEGSSLRRKYEAAHTTSPISSIERFPNSMFFQTQDSLPASQSQTILSQEESSALETANREMISRIVMAGMRLYGHQQRRKGEITQEDLPNEIDATGGSPQDEYKLIYHQTYKATIFALRTSIRSVSLQAHIERVREIVDNLLSLFCSQQLPG